MSVPVQTDPAFHLEFPVEVFEGLQARVPTVLRLPLVLRCDISLPGARPQPPLGDPHVDVVHPAVTFGRSKADEVLTV